MSDKQGATTRLMLAAPLGAIYVWCNSHLDYPRRLARHLNREDLIVEPLNILFNPARIAGRSQSYVVLDHAARKSPLVEPHEYLQMQAALAYLQQTGRLIEPVTTSSHTRCCTTCKTPLTRDEIEYLGNTCNNCEGMLMAQLDEAEAAEQRDKLEVDSQFDGLVETVIVRVK